MACPPSPGLHRSMTGDPVPQATGTPSMTRTRLLAALLLAASVASVAPAVQLDAWVKQTTALKAEDQLTAVRDKLRDLNGEFRDKQGEISGTVVDGVVRGLSFDAAYLS